MLYKNAVRSLGDLVSPRALERLIEGVAQERGLAVEQLTVPQLSDILKRDVFRRLQLTVPAHLAKRRIEAVLTELQDQPQSSAVNISEAQRSQVSDLENTLRTYTLYFDWPEVKRLRSLIGVVQGELEAGRTPPPNMLEEGEELRETLSSKLSESLVRQEADLAELRAEFTRVEGVGGPKVRRLSTLLQTVEDAQKEGTLAMAELERAHNIARELRKQVASSVVEGLPSGEEAPERDQSLRQMDLEHEKRLAGDLAREFAPLLRVNSALATRLQEAREQLERQELYGEECFGALRGDLESAQQTLVSEQLLELSSLEARLSQLSASVPAVEKARLNAAVARGTLESGSLATDELSLLRQGVPILERQGESAEEALENQRELLEIEQAARDLPAIEGLQQNLAAASQALERGESADLSALWAIIDKRKGEAAQERENYDNRARRVLDEYGQYRYLAGETILRLGRLADTLRSQLALSKMSAEARAHYVRTLEDAEALLGEARAEFETAREVTSQFGEDALAGLLDVFSLEPEEESAPLPETAPLPAGLWEMRGGTVTRGAADPQVWSLSRLAALLAELPEPLAHGELRLSTSEGVWLLQPHEGGYRAALGFDEAEARERLDAFPDGA